MLNNNTIALLVNSGIANLDFTTVTPSLAYKVYKFRREVLKAFEECREQTQELFKQILSEEEQEQKSKLEEKKAFNSDEYKALLKKIEESELIISLYTSEVETVKPVNLPYEEYFKLKQANEFLKPAFWDELLEGIIWKEEEEEETKKEEGER